MSNLRYSGKFKKHFISHIFHLNSDQNLSISKLLDHFLFCKYFAIKSASLLTIAVHISLSLRIFFRINSKVLYLFLDYGYKLQGCLLEWFCLFTFPPAVHLLFQIFTTLKDKYL